MLLRFGLEMSIVKEKLPGYTATLIKEVASIATIIDRDEQLLLVATAKEALELQDYLITKNLFEDFFLLIELHNPETKETFYDYGIHSLQEKDYLFLEMVSVFTIESGTKEQIEMSLYQFEEHLICIDTLESKKYYYVDRNFIELVNKIAQAYDIEVSFFDLDKLSEKD
ncbi:hypothetical protein IMZ08_07835 [Bacillus luteolus]|uniref:Uncharacterized protein n=1 Tax=Litchfieldia luteola TaxID=682179 RepID=A0ABR9QHI5_9BACI|nr:hypothetical protein [Cytobacillus luteolus]MBE4907960.1 hypothetical protein [Cytobacillus luteolus]MBP1942740.1 hypothetical protein [Cytobacillus luteolus]